MDWAPSKRFPDVLDSFILTIALVDDPIVFQLRNELTEVWVACTRSHEPSAGLCRGPELGLVDSAQEGSAGSRERSEGLLGKGRPRATKPRVRGASLASVTSQPEWA